VRRAASPLQRLRRKANLTQAAVAEHLGVSERQVRNWEHGRAEPPARVVLLLAELFKVPAGVVLASMATARRPSA
jgi:transcriptional regulator with XRE-family HTH domain